MWQVRTLLSFQVPEGWESLSGEIRLWIWPLPSCEGTTLALVFVVYEDHYVCL